MDANKSKKLREIGYRILPTCRLCVHSEEMAGEWGTCKIQTYAHLKHSETVRQLSIHASGSCPKFELDPAQVTDLHGFAEFVVEK